MTTDNVRFLPWMHDHFAEIGAAVAEHGTVRMPLHPDWAGLDLDRYADQITRFVPGVVAVAGDNFMDIRPCEPAQVAS